MYYGDRWMQGDMVTRHKGIATESAFSLAMFRWVNHIIEFIDVVHQLDEIGIVEIEKKVERLKQRKAQIEQLLELRTDKAPFMLFQELRQRQEVVQSLNELSESYYSSSFSEASVFGKDEDEEHKEIDINMDDVSDIEVRTADLNLSETISHNTG